MEEAEPRDDRDPDSPRFGGGGCTDAARIPPPGRGDRAGPGQEEGRGGAGRGGAGRGGASLGGEPPSLRPAPSPFLCAACCPGLEPPEDGVTGGSATSTPNSPPPAGAGPEWKTMGTGGA
ncbi:hypothetical protein P7K49_032870 [Saguinus oedipus]|uniref:Uncharacterized protein n=1 Tax=Saguinus oedipus TaxID=9490 RepID=A0ABQ9TRE0_SAGOE|nr:hypothetical protein P7K49_032870 [Saguinus oedipus]